MGIIVDRDWLKETIENKFSQAVKILFLFTNDMDKSEALAEEIFINLTGEREFESERHFEMWLLRQTVNAGGKARLENKENVTDRVLLLDKIEKLVFHLHNYCGYSIREISGILKKSEDALERKLDEAQIDLGIENTDLIKKEHKEVFDKITLSDDLKERMNEDMETNKLIEVKEAYDLQKEKTRRVCWIASLALIVVCLIIGSGIL